MLCYHEEYFTLGVLSTFFVVAMVILFEDGLKSIFERIQKNLNLKSKD